MHRVNNYGKYGIFYSSYRGQFIGQDENGEEVEHAATEKELVEKLKARDKSNFQRIPIFKVDRDGTVEEGALTSLTNAGREAWVSMPKTRYGSGRGKIILGSGLSGYYARIPENEQKVAQIRVIRKQVEEHLAEITSIRDTLDHAINYEYFAG